MQWQPAGAVLPRGPNQPCPSSTKSHVATTLLPAAGQFCRTRSPGMLLVIMCYLKTRSLLVAQGRQAQHRFSRGESLCDHSVGKDPPAERTGQRQNRGMRTRLGCLSHKSDSYNDFTAILPDKPNRALKLSTEEATRWADSFDVLLSHKYGLAAFRAFLKTEFSEENLEFWLACEDFKKTRSAAKLASKAQRIFEEFIDVQAPREVNIDFQTRELTRRNMQEPSLSCFDQAQGKVHSLMEKDSYPRFLRSKIYTDLLSQTQRRLS
ncbi:regulator of G-protein signaling 8 isoform X2 [Anser cygnoides]|uniref:regulator of G-protein signaling 8 isoform X2 n=2 Tax=Neognathae TaxID=8825 RepID=UPI002009B7D6|nr:regulator of G-protein signaling 8 isoform X2 [Anser cygnoides]